MTIDAPGRPQSGFHQHDDPMRESESSAARPYSVAVALTGNDTSAFLRVVATLHRRGVPVTEAALTRPTSDRRTFAATFVATERQAQVVAASLRRLVDVVDVDVYEPTETPDDPGSHGSCCVLHAHPITSHGLPPHIDAQ
ncbi:hypothetical protein [Actinomadura welshii]|uniref:hypothetical protein n=1 Tax=Actinomadura welshii TaxID=3103817 RepID=UPI0005260258|nr:hypothetical protein [Actinomadura madurae]